MIPYLICVTGPLYPVGNRSPLTSLFIVPFRGLLIKLVSLIFQGFSDFFWLLFRVFPGRVRRVWPTLSHLPPRCWFLNGARHRNGRPPTVVVCAATRLPASVCGPGHGRCSPGGRLVGRPGGAGRGSGRSGFRAVESGPRRGPGATASRVQVAAGGRGGWRLPSPTPAGRGTAGTSHRPPCGPVSVSPRPLGGQRRRVVPGRGPGAGAPGRPGPGVLRVRG